MSDAVSANTGAARHWWPWLAAFLPFPFAAWFVAGPFVAPDAYLRFMAPEGPHETLQLVPLAVCIVASGYILLRGTAGRDPLLRTWCWLALLGSAYAFGEEASWGQHLLGWDTPQTWAELNRQEETNLHNVSPVFDQLPRLLLNLFSIVGGIVLPLALLLRPSLLGSGTLRLMVPPLAALPTAVMAQLARLPVTLPELFDNIGRRGYAAGETKEFFLYLFTMIYLVTLAARLDRRT